MIDNETVRKASEIGIIDVVDAIKLIDDYFTRYAPPIHSLSTTL